MLTALARDAQILLADSAMNTYLEKGAFEWAIKQIIIICIIGSIYFTLSERIYCIYGASLSSDDVKPSYKKASNERA